MESYLGSQKTLFNTALHQHGTYWWSCYEYSDIIIFVVSLLRGQGEIEITAFLTEITGKDGRLIEQRMGEKIFHCQLTCLNEDDPLRLRWFSPIVQFSRFGRFSAGSLPDSLSINSFSTVILSPGSPGGRFLPVLRGLAPPGQVLLPTSSISFSSDLHESSAVELRHPSGAGERTSG